MKDLLILTLILAGGLGAQTLDRTKPPQTPAIPDYKLPATYETKLPNGLSVIMVQDARFPMVTARLAFAAGTKYDPPAIPGLARNVASLLTEGTKTRTAKQIAEEMARIGGDLTGSATADAVEVGGSALSENFGKLLNLIADCGINASFPEDEVALRKQNGKQELMAAMSQPAFLATRELTRRVYGDHPYGHVTTQESLDKITQAALIDYRNKYLGPNNAALILVGQLPARDQAMSAIRQEFGSWKEIKAPADPAKTLPEPKKQTVLVNRPGSVQADVHIGQLAATRSSDEYFPEVVGNTILGGAFDSRLFNDIREKMGYAYDAHSEVVPLKDAATFAGVMQVRNEVVEPAVKAMLDHMSQMTKERVSGDELTSAKNYQAGVYILILETQAGLAGQLAFIRAAGLPTKFLEDYITRIRSVEPDQVQKVAAKYFDPSRASVVVVGDASKIQPALEKFGSVEVVQPK